MLTRRKLFGAALAAGASVAGGCSGARARLALPDNAPTTIPTSSAPLACQFVTRTEISASPPAKPHRSS